MSGGLMKRFLLVALALGLAAAFVVPQLADAAGPVGEPMRPIVSVSDPIIYKYPGPRVPIPCDGTHVYTHDSARVEVDVRADDTWPDRYAPSEHWFFTVAAFVKLKPGQTSIWGDTWKHANIPLGWSRGAFEAMSSNIWNIRATPGEWVVRITLTTDMTEQVFVRECRFKVLAS